MVHHQTLFTASIITLRKGTIAVAFINKIPGQASDTLEQISSSLTAADQIETTNLTP